MNHRIRVFRTLAILPISYVLFYSFKMFVIYLTVASEYVCNVLDRNLHRILASIVSCEKVGQLHGGYRLDDQVLVDHATSKIDW